MGDMDDGDYWRDIKAGNQERRKRNLKAFDPTGWNRHCETHFSKMLLGKKLDYWPSTRKFQWNGRVMQGDVYGFIRNREKEHA